MGWWDGVSLRGVREDGTATAIRMRDGGRTSLARAALLGLFSDVVMLSNARHGIGPHRIEFVFVYPLLLMALGAAMAQLGGGLTLTERELVNQWSLGRNLPWTEIADLSVSRDFGTRRLVARSRSGKVVKLPLWSWASRSKVFDRKVATIVTWWELRRGW